jgi:uncharacterized protein (TIGR01777 family)
VRVAVTGSTGLIGTRLVAELRAEGHEVLRLVRPQSAVDRDERIDGAVDWDPQAGTIDADALEGLDAVVHLAGVGIGDARWTTDRKAQVLTSRTRSTSLVARTLAGLDAPPKVLLSASGVGWYGDTGARITDESGPPGHDFPARVCHAWERETEPARQAGLRVAHLRSGVVQSTQGGALARQLPFFRLGIGGRSGSGRQYLSWITLTDEIRAIRFLIDRELEGPVNLVAPEPVTNGTYARTLGHVLRRPTTIIPMIGPRTLFGRELADSLLLVSQRVVPAKLLEAGFDFEHPEIEGALRAVLA